MLVYLEFIIIIIRLWSRRLQIFHNRFDHGLQNLQLSHFLVCIINVRQKLLPPELESCLIHVTYPISSGDGTLTVRVLFFYENSHLVVVRSTGSRFLGYEPLIEMITTQSLWHITIWNQCMSCGMNK